MKNLHVFKVAIALGLIASTIAPSLANPTLFGKEIPTEMVGKWKWGMINPVWFEDKYTGKYSGHGGGVSAYFEFDKSGRFRHHVYVETNSSGWKTQTFTTMSGTVSVDGDVFRLNVEKGSYRSRSNRIERHNFDRKMTDDERAAQSQKVYKWARSTDDNGNPILLVVNGGQGNPTTFRQDK